MQTRRTAGEPRGTWNYTRLAFALLCYLCFIPASEVEAQTCEPWNGEPPICSQVLGLKVGDPIFIPPEITMSEMQQRSYLVITGVSIFEVPIPPACETALVKVVCAQFYRPCLEVDNETVVLPVNMCRQLCYDYINFCANYTSETGFVMGGFMYYPPGYQAPPTCLEIDVWAQNNSLFPVNHTTYAVETEDGPQTLNVDCNRGLNWTSVTDCSPPLTREKQGEPCSFECPLPAYSDDEYDGAKTMQLVVGFFSWAASFLLLVTYVLNPGFRKFSANLITMTALSAHIASLAIILPVFSSHETVWCGTSQQLFAIPLEFMKQINSGNILDEIEGTRYVFDINDLVFKSHWCRFQGVVLHFSFLCSTTWWCIISVNMFITLFAQSKYLPSAKNRQIAFHLIGWGVPFILALVPLAANKISFPPGGTFCFVSPEDDNLWMILFWFVPVGLLLLIGFLSFIAAIIRVVFLFSTISSDRQRIIATYARVLVFLFTFLLVYSFIFSYSVRVGLDQEDIEREWARYLACFTFFSGIKSCSLSEEASNYPLAMLRGFGMAVLGFLLFLNFFFSVTVPSFWLRLVKAGMHGGWSEVVSIVTNPKKSRKGTGASTASRRTKSARSSSPASSSSVGECSMEVLETKEEDSEEEGSSEE
ncbi:hypothetical protein QOT17_017826 [Balamuthia mandrillaris]